MVRHAEDDGTLETLTRVLIDTLDPDRIILFGSRARGEARDDSDYDLAIEVEAPDFRGLRDAAEQAVRRALGQAAVDLHLRRPGLVEARRDDPGYIDWDIAREGIVLYAAPDRPLQVREQPRPGTSVSIWHRHAEIDMLTIDACLAAPVVPWEAVGFHAQQAAEKHLKAALIADGIRPMRTHDLVALVARLRTSRPTLPDLTLECEVLARFAVRTRYPDPEDEEFTRSTTTAAEGERAVAAMRSIVTAVAR